MKYGADFVIQRAHLNIGVGSRYADPTYEIKEIPKDIDSILKQRA